MAKHNGVNWARTYNSLTFLDKDDDYIAHELGSTTGLANLLETNMWLVAASLEMQGVLFGDLRGGLSQESDAMHRYAVTIENRCNSYYRPVLQKLLGVLFAMYNVPGVPDFDFNPLDLEERNEKKTAAITSYAEMLGTLLNQGTISKYQAALSLKDYINRQAVNIEFDELQLNKLKYEAEMEILATYKTAGKAAPAELLGEQFPEETNPFAGRVTPATGTEFRERVPAVEAPSQEEQRQFDLSEESENETV